MMSRTESKQRTVASDVFIVCLSTKNKQSRVYLYSLTEETGNFLN
jgi:hypothetical protein